MKIGDIVKFKNSTLPIRVGVAVDFIDKKCWRTAELGPMIDWRKVDPEPHAVILFEDGTMSLPIVDLEIINETR